MSDDEGFSLGFEDSKFELTGTVAGEKQKESSVINKEEKNPVNKQPESNNVYTYKTVYEWFVKNKDPTIDFVQYLKTKPEIYLLFNIIPFTPLPKNILNTVETFKLKCFDDIDKNLANTNENIEKGELIKECLNKIEYIFRYYDSEELNFEASLKQNLFEEKLYVSLKEKEGDGVISLSEINNLLMVAQQIYLWDGKSEDRRAEILNWIRDKAIIDNCRIESYRETFLRMVKNKPPLERINVYSCIRKLDLEFWNLKCTELGIYNQQIEIDSEELHDEMMLILNKENLLVNKEDIYLQEVFINEKEHSEYDFSLKLPPNYYQYLKTVAIYKYYFNEEEWIAFTRKQGISSLGTVSVAFILGTQKASSIDNIATLLENNRTKAIERIIDGDLETYLIHIGQRNLANSIGQIKNDFKDDKNTMFQKILNTLRGIKDNVKEDDIEVDDRQTLVALISRNAPVQEMVQYLLKRKTREKLNQRVLSDSDDRNDLNEYLNNNNTSFVCLCMNYLHDFPNESNASGYKNIYEMYANYVLDILIEKNAFNLFYSGFIQLINLDYVSQTFKDKLNQTNKNMQKDFESFCENINKKSKSKSLFGFK